MTLSSQFSIGLFLTNLDVYNQMCNSWALVYDELLVINRALPAMETVTRFLNLPIDLDKRRVANERRRQMNEEERLKAREELDKAKSQGVFTNVLFAIDTIPLQLTNVGFQYEVISEEETLHEHVRKSAAVMQRTSTHVIMKKLSSFYNEGSSASEADPSSPTSSGMPFKEEGCMSNWNLMIPQGTLTALIGKHDHGKGTLLKLIGGVLLPTDGMFFAPPQLRIFYVTQEPLFFYESLFENLSFRLSYEDKASPHSYDRVYHICKWIGVNELALGLLDTNTKRDWVKTLPHSQLKRLHLARALVANPEVLVIEKPSLGLDHHSSANVFRLLRQHVKQKGLIKNPKQTILARPRTVIFTTEKPEACHVADAVHMVDMHEIVSVDKAQLTEGNLLKNEELRDSFEW
jgi:ABC-type multidrug transport system fused ATPase/permease subunit